MSNMSQSLEYALKSAKLRLEDGAAVELARQYARLIDQSPDRDTLDKLGPKLQNILTALHMTPAGRTTPGSRGGAKDDSGAASGPDSALADLIGDSTAPDGFDISAYLDPSVTASHS